MSSSPTPTPLRVLVACEFSGTVRDAFRAAGHEAVSCDLLPTDALGPHYQGDARDLLEPGRWDLLIAHPPCTYLANSGAHWLHRQQGRWPKMEAGARFFRQLLHAPVPHVAVENPVMHKYAVAIVGRRQDQTIQPYEYGHPESKRTGLWLKNLPHLQPTHVLPKPERGYWDNQTPSGQNKLGPSPDRWKQRSTFYTGWAAAMARQWGPYVLAAVHGGTVPALGPQLNLGLEGGRR